MYLQKLYVCKYLNILLFILIAFLCCKNANKEDKTTSNSDSRQPKLYCSGETIEQPRGELIYVNSKYTSDVDSIRVQISFEQDSLYLFAKVESKETPGDYFLLETTAYAYNDIDPESVSVNFLESEDNEGKKDKTYIFYIHSKEEKRIFKQRIYTCFEDTNFQASDMRGSTTSCFSKEVAEATVAKIKEKLKK